MAKQKHSEISCDRGEYFLHALTERELVQLIDALFIDSSEIPRASASRGGIGAANGVRQLI